MVSKDLFLLGVDTITYKSHEDNLNFSAKELAVALK
jgi:hypothetical protein